MWRLLGGLVQLIALMMLINSGVMSLMRHPSTDLYVMIVESSHQWPTSPLYLIAPNGDVLRRLSDARGHYESYAPNGEWLYFTNEQDSKLYRVNIWQGHSSQRVVVPEANTAYVRGWLGDGAYVVIAYTLIKDNNYCEMQIVVARPDGSDMRPLQLSMPPYSYCGIPRRLTLSPDERYFAFDFRWGYRYSWAVVPPDLVTAPPPAKGLPIKRLQAPYTFATSTTLYTIYPDGRVVNFSEESTRSIRLQLPNDRREVVWDFGDLRISMATMPLQHLWLYDPQTNTKTLIIEGFGTAVETHAHEPIVYVWWDTQSLEGGAYDARINRFDPERRPGPLLPRSTTMFTPDGLRSVVEPLPPAFQAIVRARNGQAKYITPAPVPHHTWHRWSLGVGIVIGGCSLLWLRKRNRRQGLWRL